MANARIAICYTYQDMIYYKLTGFLQSLLTDGQTEEERCTRAQDAICTRGSKEERNCTRIFILKETIRN